MTESDLLNKTELKTMVGNLLKERFFLTPFNLLLTEEKLESEIGWGQTRQRSNFEVRGSKLYICRFSRKANSERKQEEL